MVVEAVTAATPVLASRISGNVGMLGAHYPGYFEPGDAAGLARCLVQAARDKAYLARLKAACVERRPLFSPRNEQRAITALVAGLLE